MCKYIIFILSLYTPLHCMQSLIEKEPRYCFKNLTVLNYDGNENNAVLIAKNAMLVHCDTKKTNNITNDIEQSKKHPSIKNLFFRHPQHNAYDFVTIYNPYMLNKKNINIHLKNIYNYLTSSGKFYFFIRTKENKISLPEQAFATVYTQRYQPITTLQAHYFSENELRNIILSHGYNIVSYENKNYETTIQNRSHYLETLALTFIDNIRHLGLPKEKTLQFVEEFITLVIQKNEENNPGKLKELWNFTKIILCKIDKLKPPLDQSKPPIFIGNSLLSASF